jgi:hypothetical protein
MIKNIQEKKNEILFVIKNEIQEIDAKYRTGKSLDKYRIVLNNRKLENNVKDYISNYLSDIYDTLIAWDMNKRGAKILKLPEIIQSFKKNTECFMELEGIGTDITKIKESDLETIKIILCKLYYKLDLMKSGARLVSFSKTMHFIFPNLFMPMDRQNTLRYFYSNYNESFNKYFEIFTFFLSIAHEEIEWKEIIGKEQWNTTIPKIIDNAIILQMKK